MDEAAEELNEANAKQTTSDIAIVQIKTKIATLCNELTAQQRKLKSLVDQETERSAKGRPPDARLRAQRLRMQKVVHEIEHEKLPQERGKLREEVRARRVVGEGGGARGRCRATVSCDEARKSRRRDDVAAEAAAFHALLFFRRGLI